MLRNLLRRFVKIFIFCIVRIKSCYTVFIVVNHMLYISDFCAYLIEKYSYLEKSDHPTKMSDYLKMWKEIQI